VIVADTNLLAYLYLPGEHTARAEQVLMKDREWAAPILWRSEFRNILALYLRRDLISAELALEAFRDAETTVMGREYAVETSRVLTLVQQSSCSAYDCEFVALAQELGIPLVTSDKEVLKNFRDIAVSPTQFCA
jgi:predicted nucleic acid-binding protein